MPGENMQACRNRAERLSAARGKRFIDLILFALLSVQNKKPSDVKGQMASIASKADV
jgi:hypothetical protein